MEPQEDDNDDKEPYCSNATDDEQTGPYFLESVLDEVQLSADGSESDIGITCVEYWDNNLYVGTSGGEVLHYVYISPEPSDAVSQPSFILASRSQPPFVEVPLGINLREGVQQILLLPRVTKACVLCNGTLTFYSLPELSPAFTSTQVKNCNWVGGTDLNLNDGNLDSRGELIMISLKSRIRLVRIGDEPRPALIRNIEYAGALTALRRGSFACVANSHSYALLDIDHQQKIPLFSISSLDNGSGGGSGGDIEALSSSDTPEYSRAGLGPREHSNERPTGGHAHGRSTSLGGIVHGFGQQLHSSRPQSQDRSRHLHSQSAVSEHPAAMLSPSAAPEARSARSPHRETGQVKPLPPLPTPLEGHVRPHSASSLAHSTSLVPHILSPTPNEFLLTTGTTEADPGVGIFVNLDGDVCRGTLEFQRYPKSVVLDMQGGSPELHDGPSDGDSRPYVLALVEPGSDEGQSTGLDIQLLDELAGKNEKERSWLALPSTTPNGINGATGHPCSNVGIRTVNGNCSVLNRQLTSKLQLVQLRLPRDDLSLQPLDSTKRVGSHQNTSKEDGLCSEQSQESHISSKALPRDSGKTGNTSRARDEEQFSRRIGMQHTSLVLWVGSQIWWIVRSPVLIRLDAVLENVINGEFGRLASQVARGKVISLLRSIQGQEARTEAQFLSLGYIRQKASLMLFAGLMTVLMEGASIPAELAKETEEALIGGGVDPRVTLAMIPLLCQDVVEGLEGIWVYRGLQIYIDKYLHGIRHLTQNIYFVDGFSEEFLNLVRRYLSSWRRKKGFGSIPDEKQVFESVDATLLHILLELDKRTAGPTTAASTRAELYAVVDQGVDCFDRAVALLESYGRLYVLSRLYQSRKMSRRVLATWKRILEGEVDNGSDFKDGENEVRKYLVKIRDASLVEEYGAWLARRSPEMGFQVFCDENSRVKFEPDKAIQVLRSQAPEALKHYLENLVFGKNNSRYANELICFYLDNILSELATSEPARSILAESYEAYRALRPPRPTYREFITENALNEEWWRDRLRLLQLLGGTHGTALPYDVSMALDRIEAFEEQLVPEMIILYGRQARHQQALRLLTHGLGDYDSAVNYCLLGGASIFHPTFGALSQEQLPSRDEQATLFGYMLSEFLRIEDAGVRVEQTGSLLEQYARWFDVQQVLDLVPESWPIELLSGFLVSSLRRIMAERSEMTVAKSLSGAENLQVSARIIEKYEGIGPTVEAAD